MKTVIILLLVLLRYSTFCQPEYAKYNHVFGIKASSLVGYGAYYGYRLTETFKLQATGIYYLYQKTDNDGIHAFDGYTMGMELQKDLRQVSLYRVYLMGGSYYYFDDDYELNLEEKGGEFETHVIKNSINFGIGIGVEFYFGRVSVSGELGYKYFHDSGEKYENDNPEEFEILRDWNNYTEKETKIGLGFNVGFIF